MPIVDDKSNYNRRYNENHNAFPVRLGILKEIIQEHAFTVEESVHSCVRKALEVCFLPQLIERSKKVDVERVTELIEIGLDLPHALKELNIPESLFYLAVPDDKINHICRHLKPKQAELLRQKVGYYKHIQEKVKPVPCATMRVVKMRCKRFDKVQDQLGLFY